MSLFYDHRNKLLNGRIISRLGTTLLVMIFVKPRFLAAPICLGPKIEQKKVYLLPNVLLLIIHFQEKISCVGTIVYLTTMISLSDADLLTFFLLISPQTLDSMNYAHNSDLPTNKFRICFFTARKCFYKLL